MLQDFLALFQGGLFQQVFGIVIDLAPLWLPIALLALFWQVWLTYVRAAHIANQEYVLLEIQLPREQRKSPAAMELVLNYFQQGGPNTFIKAYWKGEVTPWFSLELVSIGGDVHFFIWTRAFYKRMVEYAVYSQFPEAEVHEVPDYTRFFEYDKEQIALWSCEFETKKDNAYSLKTYIDYGLHENPKEEEKVDPLTPVMEYLASIGRGEQIWIQILIRKHEGKLDDKAEKLVHELMGRDPKTKTPKQTVGSTEDRPGWPVNLQLNKEEEQVINGIKRKIAKPLFDVGIRGIYMAEKDVFNPISIPGLIGAWRQYSSGAMNAFKPTRGLIPFKYPWQDYKEIRQNRARYEMFDAYRKRSYFHAPYKRKPFVLSSEELATLYHFPGRVVQTPTIKRVESKRAEPPPNLPR